MGDDASSLQAPMSVGSPGRDRGRWQTFWAVEAYFYTRTVPPRGRYFIFLKSRLPRLVFAHAEPIDHPSPAALGSEDARRC